MISTLVIIVTEAIVIFAAIGVGMSVTASLHARRAPKPPPEPDLTCGCGHVLAYHDPQTGECNQLASHGHYDEIRRSRNSSFTDRVWISDQIGCKCQQYTGELTADWYARSITRGDTA